MDPYRIDSHKLLYHVGRVHDWIEGRTTYPIYVEVSPSGECNHRCRFCALDFMGYRKRFLEAARIQERFGEMGRLGVKSVMFGGEGEPLLHQEITALVRHARCAGMDVAFTTNGVLLDGGIADEILPLVEWIKVSCNAGTRESYAKIHRTRAGDFDRVMENLSYAVRKRDERGYTCTLGMQLILLPENAAEVLELATMARSTGLDYLVVKPYSQHLSSRSKRYKDIRYETFISMGKKLARLNTKRFQVIFRTETMKRWDTAARGYGRCLALPFWCYVDAGGNVWGCSAFLGDERFLYGNVYESTFQEIWEGETRKASLRWVEEEMDINSCRINCRMDKINQYLWELKHPPRHLNFI